MESGNRDLLRSTKTVCDYRRNASLPLTTSASILSANLAATLRRYQRRPNPAIQTLTTTSTAAQAASPMNLA